MDLKLIDDSGKAGTTVAGSDALFAREYNEALIHQLVIAFQANARSGNRAQKSRGQINKSHKKPWQQKGTGRARAGQANSPLWRGGGKIFPNLPDENFSQKVNRKMYRAGIASILSQLVREGRLSVVERIVLDAPKTRVFAQKIKAFGLSGTAGVNEGRLMTVLLAPVVSEKATFVADKHNQVIFRVRPDATKKDVKAAVELVWKDKKVEVESVQIVNVHGKPKRFGAYSGRRRRWKKAYVCLKPGHEINFAQEA